MSCGCDSLTEELIPYEIALQNLLYQAEPVDEVETVNLTDSLNRVMAADVPSSINVPPADNSAMDGYAIRISDVRADENTRLKVTQRIPAGETGVQLEAGAAARIFTGAPIPPGADAVIMQEQVECDDDTMSFSAAVRPGQNIRSAGEDIKLDDVILRKGFQLRAQEMGLAASIGCHQVSVTRKVKVGIFFTGDELVEPGKPLSPGKIYDSNRYTLRGLLQSLNCEIIDLGIVGDTLQLTQQAILKATEKADLVITSGGVSVGDEDHVRIALEQMGELFMWRLNIKPGKPLAFGKVKDTAFIGLPGNPVSAFATFCLFVCPFIKKLQGRTEMLTQSSTVIAAFDWPKPDKRREFVRSRLQHDGKNRRKAYIYPHQGSGVLTSTSWADGLIVIEENQTIKAGDLVEYLSFRDILG